jgi:hypothetical protein
MSEQSRLHHEEDDGHEEAWQKSVLDKDREAFSVATLKRNARARPAGCTPIFTLYMTFTVTSQPAPHGAGGAVARHTTTFS